MPCIVLYTSPPFVFLCGLQIGVWILGSTQDPHHLRASPAFWGREAYRKWECASPQTVWGVVEGRMLIKIINNCWKEQWITPPLSDRPGMLLELAALAPLPQTLQMIPSWDPLLELLSRQIEQLTIGVVLLYWQHPLGIAWPREMD